MLKNINLQQNLVDEVYDKWNTEECKGMDRLEVITKYFTPKHKMAIQLGDMNSQVNNGGWTQWHYNNYDGDLEDLIAYSKKGLKLDLKSFNSLLEILTHIKLLGNPEDYNKIDECECFSCGGSGIVTDYDEDDNEIEVECVDCGGTGTCDEDIDGEEEYCDLLSEFDDKYYDLEDKVLNDFNTLLEKFDELKNIDISNVKIQSTVKPKCKLTGTDGNVFSVIGKVSKCLREVGLKDEAEEFRNKALKSHSYDSVLALCFEYVDVL